MRMFTVSVVTPVHNILDKQLDVPGYSLQNKSEANVENTGSWLE